MSPPRTERTAPRCFTTLSDKASKNTDIAHSEIPTLEADSRVSSPDEDKEPLMLKMLAKVAEKPKEEESDREKDPLNVNDPYYTSVLDEICDYSKYLQPDKPHKAVSPKNKATSSEI